ncbi:MAG: glycosyltransferase family 39 protein, partial [Candidatus Hydrogenedentes bacterium]|nr:glycosyltransferase family 39 protein [Candidatus Hydrogenedentota bacterium]
MSEQISETQSAAHECLAWVAAAFVVRAIFFFITPQVIDSADSILYLEAAQKFSDGNFCNVYPRIPHLYPLLTAALSHVTADIETAAIAISFMCGCFLIVPVFLLSIVLHDRPSARVAALTVTIWPWLVDYSCRVAPEALYCLFWFESLRAALGAMDGNRKLAFILPIFVAALYLSRPEGILIAPALLAAGFMFSTNKRAAVLHLLPACLVLVMIALVHYAYVQHLVAQTGIASRLTANAVQYSLVDRGRDTAATAMRLVFVVTPTMMGVLGIFAVVGIAAKSTTRDRRAEFMVAFLALAQFAAAAMSTFAEPRYVMATIIAISLWSARGAAILAAKAAASARWRALRFAPAA